MSDRCRSPTRGLPAGHFPSPPLNHRPRMAAHHQMILDLQRTAGNQAVTQALVVARSDEGAAESQATPVDLLGVVDQDGRWAKGGAGGLTLRNAPNTGAGTDLGRLEHGKDHVYVKGRLPGGWLQVTVVDGGLKGGSGYVFGYDAQHNHINTDLPPSPSAPDAGAQLHTVAHGEQAFDFVRRHYGAVTQEKGNDERFFANVLLNINQQARRPGVYRQKVARRQPGLPVPVAMEEVWLKAGSEIWLPSTDYALSLKGTVSAGSWARDTWEKVKKVGEALAGIASFIAGAAVGVIDSVKDLIVGTLKFLWDTLRSLGGNLIDAAKSIWGLLSDPKKRKALLEALDANLREKWDAEGFLRRWYNRGWLIGYATMEVVVTFLLPEVAAALKGSKFAGKAAEFLKVVGSTEIGQAVKTTVAAGKAKLATVASKAGEAGQIAKKVVGAGAAKVVKKSKIAIEKIMAKVAGADKLARLAQQFGYAEEKLAGFVQFAREHKVTVWLRKSNPLSPKRLAEGALPKPMDIKAKTIGPWDLHLNPELTEADLGLAGYFRPAELPPVRPAKISRSDWVQIRKAHAERTAEFEKLSGDMAKLAKPGPARPDYYKVERGVVKQVEAETGKTAALAGDIDLYQITHADGSLLTLEEYGHLADLLVEQDLIEHGAHLWWRQRGDFDPKAFAKIVERHNSEALVKVGGDSIGQVLGSRVPG